MMSAADRINLFRADLTSLRDSEMVGKHILSGGCYALGEHPHWRLRASVSDGLGVHLNQVVVVGSARLGFTIAPTKLLRPFSDASDIDVAIVSSDLFDDYWRLLFSYEQGGYWERSDDFKRYLFRGWMRPDLLPNSKSFAPRQRWWDLFLALTASAEFGPYKIRGGLYKSWFFLNSYHEANMAACRGATEPVKLDETLGLRI